MIRDQTPDDVIRDWLEEEASGQLPDWVLTATFERTRTQRQRRAWSGWRNPMTLILRGPATAPPLRSPWILILAAILALALMGGALIVGARLLSTPPPDLGPLAVAMPPTACPADTVLKSGDIATIAGTGMSGDTGDDGPAIAATLLSSEGGSIATDPIGALYFSQADQAIRRIGTDGIITTVAGPSAVPPFEHPTGVAFDSDGNMYVADLGWIWKRDLQGRVSAVAGTGVDLAAGDEGPAVDAQVNAFGVTVGPGGDLYLDDYMATGIRRRIDTAGIIHRFSGNGGYGALGDGGPATDAAFGLGNYAIAADRHGNVFLSDNDHHRIRKVDPSGTVTTVVGNGVAGYSGDGGPATEASISDPRSMVIDEAGNLVFVDRDEGVVRKVDPSGTISTIAGTGTRGFAGDCGPALDATFAGPSLIAIHDGILYVVDFWNNRIRMIVP
jgi:hypothetical protein